MRERLASIAIAAALGCASGSACAMTANESSVRCTVLNGEKLPAESGGADALCRTIATAVEAQAPGRGYAVEISVLGSSRLSAIVTSRGGEKIAEQQLSVMDKPLTGGSFDRFAKAIAAELAKVGAGKS